MATVSVIIPCYNRGDLVSETITNMLNQTWAPDEVIVVDDGSTDNSVEVLQSFGAKIKLIQQTNQGPGAARNAGLKVAKGELIQFMDSDDLASLNKLEVQVKALQQTEAGFAYGPWAYCYIENKVVRFIDGIIQSGAVPGNKPMLEWFTSGWSLVFQNCLFRRTVLDKAGFYRTDLMPSEDSEYFVRILLSGARGVHTPECLVFYREHNNAKITASGTSKNHRANDWTRYLQITGTYLEQAVAAMHSSTKIALASSVHSHMKFCQQHQLPILDKQHPYIKLLTPSLLLMAKVYTLFGKVGRKLKGTPFHRKEFSFKRVQTYHKKLVTDMGYRVAI